MNRRIGCSEVWGGFEDVDRDLETGSLQASLWSHSASGGRGGDIYYFSVCGGDQLTRIAVADVMGHGEQITSASSVIYGHLQQHINNPKGEDVLVGLNSAVGEVGSRVLTTAVVGSVIVRQGQCALVYAGHPPVLWWRQGSQSWDTVRLLEERLTCNLPLGVFADGCFDQCELELDPGDKLFFYTDGVIEAPNTAGEPFGEQRLIETLNREREKDPRRIKHFIHEALLDFTHGDLSHDDMTLMAISIN